MFFLQQLSHYINYLTSQYLVTDRKNDELRHQSSSFLSALQVTLLPVEGGAAGLSQPAVYYKNVPDFKVCGKLS